MGRLSRVPDLSSDPPAAGDRLPLGRSADAWLTEPLESGRSAGFGVYLHVPFCHHRCGYCDFATEAVGTLEQGERDALMRRYVVAVERDLAAQAAALAASGSASRPVTSIFVGGGTPTLLPPQELARMIAVVGEVLDLAPDCEVTVECNPETASAELFGVLAGAGVDRISMGAQSFDPAVLGVLERQHDPERTEEAVRLVREAGIPRVSLDLIYGTPGESEQSWRESLAAVLRTGVEHVSAYALSVHANTALGRAVAAGRVPPPDDDVQRERFEDLRHVLRGAGFVHYEVANLARSDALRSRHNVLYWRHGDYLGVGVGAHAHLDGRRWWTTRSTRRYLEADESCLGDASLRDGLGRMRDVTEEEVLGIGERTLERLMLGLRLAEGLHPFDVPPLAALALDDVVRDDLVTMACGRLQATERGWFLIDETVRRLTA